MDTGISNVRANAAETVARLLRQARGSGDCTPLAEAIGSLHTLAPNRREAFAEALAKALIEPLPGLPLMDTRPPDAGD